MRLFKNNSIKAQSFLEYSLVIAVMAAAIITMQLYVSRSLQGNYKQHVDRLGGERVGQETFSPGKWYSGSQGNYLKKQTTWGFDFEWGIKTSAALMVGGSKLAVKSKISGITPPDAAEPEIEAVLDGGEDENFFEVAAASSVSPQIEATDANVAGNVKEWNYGHTEDKGSETDEPLEQAFIERAESISEKYTPIEGNPDAYSAEYGADKETPKLEERNSQYAQNEGVSPKDIPSDADLVLGVTP